MKNDILTYSVDHLEFDLVSVREGNGLEAIEIAWENGINLSNPKECLDHGLLSIWAQGSNEPKHYSYYKHLSLNIVAWKLDN